MPATIASNRNIVMGAETKLILLNRRFAYTGGSVRVVARNHDTNDSENEIFTFVSNSRFTLFFDIEFQEEIGVSLHDTIANGGVGVHTEDTLLVKLYAKGIPYPPYEAYVKVDELTLTPNPKEGGPVMGRLRGESIGAFSMPDEVTLTGIDPIRYGSPAANNVGI